MVASVHLTNNDTGDDILLKPNSDNIIEITSDYNNWTIDGATASGGSTTGTTVVIDEGVNVDGDGWRLGTTTATASVTVNGILTLRNSDIINAGSKVIVGDGGTLVLGGYATTTSDLIEFSGSANTPAGGGGTIEIAAGTTPSIIGYITNITDNDTIIIDGMTADNYTYVDGIYTLTSNGTPINGTSSFQLPAANEGTKFTVTTQNGKTYLNAVDVVCFLAGSMIRTVDGDVSVENIQIGDEVITFDWKTGAESVRPVVWAGVARATVHAGMSDDQAGYPVRILKNAVAEGVPYRDLLITAEHCLFFDGKFVPARMLVNGSSIFYDKSITTYDYYHIETAEHSVVSANGMLTESYLDTGNRRSFRQEGKVASIGSRAKTWETDAGAELCVDRAFVEPLFRTLEARKSRITEGLRNAEVVALTDDAKLHLVTETGAVIRPVRRDGQRYNFMLPANMASVRIVSRASRPADVIGPFVDDRRQMGVAIGNITFVTAARQENIAVHLAETKPEGWHADVNQHDIAWTTGNAVLPLPNLTEGTMGLLSLNILSAGPYIEDAQKEVTQVLSA
nr:Hint domain-containing protein [uncultured Acetobacter sp.]